MVGGADADAHQPDRGAEHLLLGVAAAVEVAAVQLQAQRRDGVEADAEQPAGVRLLLVGPGVQEDRGLGAHVGVVAVSVPIWSLAAGTGLVFEPVEPVGLSGLGLKKTGEPPHEMR